MSFAIVLLYLLLFYSFVASAAPNTQIATQHNNELSISSSSNTLKNINNNNVPDSDKSSILVITADGAVSSLDSQTGKENWSLRTGKPLVSSAAAVSTEAPSLIPSLDGSGEIFYLQAGEMKKLPVTVHDIVSSSPLFHSDTETETLFIGSKSTSIFAVDPITGRLLKIMSNQPNNAFGSGDDVYTYDDCPAGLPERTLLLGRADYFIRAVDPISGMERWNITVGEYIPYLTSRDKANTQSDASQLISQGNWLHSVTLGSKKVEWSAAIQAPPVTAFTLSGNTQLQKLGFAHTVPSLPSSSSSSSSVVAANSQVFVAVIEDQPFATSNPTIVFHEPYLLPSLPSPATPHDPAHSTASQIDGDPSTSLINPSPPSSTAPIIPGLYPVVEFEFRNNGTIVVDGRGEGGKVSEFSSLEKFAEIIAHQFLVPILATVLACVTVGGYLLVKSRRKKGKGRRNKKNIVEESKESEKEKVEEDKKKKKIETAEKEKITPNLTQNEDNNNANNNGEVNSGSDGNTPNKQNGKNNTPKKKAPKRKPRPSAQLSYFSNAKGKAKKNEEVEEEEVEGEKEGEQEKVEDNKEEGDKPITSTKSTRITTEDGKTRIGKLEITQTILGYGSGGTIVFEGFLHGRRVAVKRMLAQFMDLAQQEISLLIHSDEHPNVVRYHAKEEDNEFVYLALSYCPYTLNHVIDRSLHSLANFEFRKQKIEPYPYPELEGDVMRIIHELVTGVAHLHMLNIVHRDIKPQNTLLDPSNRVKISDMGLAKKLEIDQSSFSGKDTGSFGWKAPEVLTGGEGRLTKAVDIFSLGCLIYYILTKSHPFGDKYEREANILLGRSDLKEVEGWPEAHHLIRSMIQINPDARPTAQEILHHPFFWTTQQKMHFLIAASDYVEFEKPTAPVVIALDLRIGEVVRVSKTHSIHDSMSDWLSVLDPLLVANLIRYRQYKTTSLRDLLRVMRNKYNHFRDLPPDLQVVLGPVPDGFYGYFRIRFPRLLLCVFEVVREFFGNEDVFGTYFYHRPVKDKDIKDN